MAKAKTDNTAPKQLEPYAFKPGQSGNPAGRPKGSRNKLGEDFIQKLQADFEMHGVAVIAAVRSERPADYLKVVASLLPKQVEIKEGAFDGVSDEQLAALVHAARSALGVADSGTERAPDKAKQKSAKSVPAVH